MNIYWGIDIIGDNIIESVFLYYFVGVVISRVGSAVIEPILKKCKWIVFAPHEKYIEACKEDEKIEVLSAANNTYRTMVALFTLLLLGKGFLFVCEKFIFIGAFKIEIIIIALLCLFTCSYKKQTEYIKSRVEHQGEK